MSVTEHPNEVEDQELESQPEAEDSQEDDDAAGPPTEGGIGLRMILLVSTDAGEHDYPCDCAHRVFAAYLLPLGRDKQPKNVIIANTTEVQELDELEEISEVEMEEMEELEVQEVSLHSDMPDPGAMAFGEIASSVEAAVSDVGQVAMADTAIGEIGALFGEDGDGFADVGDGLKAAATFFGTKSSGNRFVFICDNSNSMGRGKFETTLYELMKSVNSMGPKQYFYVIFFSDTAYLMFHPTPANRMIPATEENKEKLAAWLYTVQMCLQTKGKEAAEAALALRPDVIYILGDGNFTDKTQQILCAPHNRRTVINTFGMNVNDAGEKELTNIAKANKGTFKRVTVSPQAAKAAKLNPIKKNNSRGPIWGIKLGAKKK